MGNDDRLRVCTLAPLLGGRAGLRLEDCDPAGRDSTALGAPIRGSESHWTQPNPVTATASIKVLRRVTCSPIPSQATARRSTSQAQVSVAALFVGKALQVAQRRSATPRIQTLHCQKHPFDRAHQGEDALSLVKVLTATTYRRCIVDTTATA